MIQEMVFDNDIYFTRLQMIRRKVVFQMIESFIKM